MAADIPAVLRSPAGKASGRKALRKRPPAEKTAPKKIDHLLDLAALRSVLFFPAHNFRATRYTRCGEISSLGASGISNGLPATRGACGKLASVRPLISVSGLILSSNGVGGFVPQVSACLHHLHEHSSAREILKPIPSHRSGGRCGIPARRQGCPIAADRPRPAPAPTLFESGRRVPAKRSTTFAPTLGECTRCRLSTSLHSRLYSAWEIPKPSWSSLRRPPALRSISGRTLP